MKATLLDFAHSMLLSRLDTLPNRTGAVSVQRSTAVRRDDEVDIERRQKIIVHCDRGGRFISAVILACSLEAGTIDRRVTVEFAHRLKEVVQNDGLHRITLPELCWFIYRLLKDTCTEKSANAIFNGASSRRVVGH